MVLGVHIEVCVGDRLDTPILWSQLMCRCADVLLHGSPVFTCISHSIFFTPPVTYVICVQSWVINE